MQRIANEGWRACCDQRDATADALAKLQETHEATLLQLQKEARRAEELQLAVSRRDVAIADLQARLAKPLVTEAAKAIDGWLSNDPHTTCHDLPNKVSRPEDQADANGEPPF